MASVRTAISIFAPVGKSIGLMTAVNPNTQKILNILLPMILPTARSRLPLRAAMTEVTSSGSDVPIAMIVAEIKKSLSPNACAIATAPLTVHVPPRYSPSSHQAINSDDFRVGNIMTSSDG